MKKLIIPVFLLCGSFMAHSQLLDVVSMQRLPLPDGYRVDQANVSPDGSYAIISSMTEPGLTKLDLSDGTTTLISSTGSNYDLQFTADSRNIVYRESMTGKDRLRRVAVKSTDVKTGKTITLVKPSRNIQAISVDGMTATAIDGGRRKVKALGSDKATGTRPVLSIDHAQLCITTDGRTTVLSPLGTIGKSYIWQSLSPDGKKIVFCVVGDGCYTCDVDGSNVKSLGILRAPVWYDNNTVVGMVNESDGYVITSSEIVASNADGTVRQTLTAPEITATYPSASKGKISFSTPQGELYIININE